MRNNWTEAEIELLKNNFEKLGAKGCAEIIPNHPKGSIAKKSQALLLKCDLTAQREYLGIKKSNLPKRFYIGYNGYVFYRAAGCKVGRLYHHLLMEEHLGRKLTINEIVHHIDCDKLNNVIENLEIVDRKEHIGIHRKLLIHKAK